MRAIAALLFFCASLLPGLSRAADMRIYNFTSAFVDCVKQHEQDEQDLSKEGNSVSGLMNGGKIIPSGEIKNNYWSYMNCLSMADSGTANESLPSGAGCSDVSVVSSYGELYIPPGLDGKVVTIRGYTWKCTGGSWGSVSEPEGSPDGCNSQVIEKNACRFEFSSSRHGQSLESWFGPKTGDASATSEGYARASCNNGTLVVNTSICTPSTCESGDMVSWIDPQTGAYCSGNVNSDGFANSAIAHRLYFPTLESAQLGSRITTGNASFACINGRWSQKGSSSCEKKEASQLNCSSLSSATGGRKYYCE